MCLVVTRLWGSPMFLHKNDLINLFSHWESVYGNIKLCLLLRAVFFRLASNAYFILVHLKQCYSNITYELDLGGPVLWRFWIQSCYPNSKFYSLNDIFLRWRDTFRISLLPLDFLESLKLMSWNSSPVLCILLT